MFLTFVSTGPLSRPDDTFPKGHGDIIISQPSQHWPVIHALGNKKLSRYHELKFTIITSEHFFDDRINNPNGQPLL